MRDNRGDFEVEVRLTRPGYGRAWGKVRRTVTVPDEDLSRETFMAAAGEAMSEVLDTLDPVWWTPLDADALGKQAREELARREVHERQMREVTPTEWLRLPLERSVAKQGSDGRTHFYDAGEVRGG